MLDLGFLEDVEKILSLTPGSRQTALFSATMPPEIRRLADKYLYDPVTVKVKTATLTVDTVEQFALEVEPEATRPSAAACSRPSGPTRRSSSCARRSAPTSSTGRCATSGMNVKALHGDMSQGSRDGVMLSFKSGRLPILVATDVAARGLDISSVTHVINYDVPMSPDVYVHRIGRTGRVGRSGRSITFYEPKQKRDIEAIERHTSTRCRRGPRARTSPPCPSSPSRAATAPSRTRHGGADAEWATLIARGGRADGIEVARPRPRRHQGGQASTASTCATSACSSASRCSRSRRPMPTASSPTPRASRCPARDQDSGPAPAWRACPPPPCIHPWVRSRSSSSTRTPPRPSRTSRSSPATASTTA